MRTVRTDYISINTSLCQACWKCLERCKQNVFGKVNLPFHKHIKIINPNNCIGCFLCSNGCSVGAINKLAEG